MKLSQLNIQNDQILYVYIKLSYSFPAVAEVETFSGGHLVASNRYHRRYSTDDGVCITTSPSKWPGVTNLRALLAREKDEDTPKLNILLCEAFVATYMSLFIYALSSCDSHILYRLVGQHFDNNTWASLFGGGVKKLLRVASTTNNQVQLVFSYIIFYFIFCKHCFFLSGR